MIQRLGTFPASSVNVGLAAAPVGLTVEIAKLQEALVKLTLAGASQIQLKSALISNPPDPAKYGLTVPFALNPATVAMNFSPEKLGLIAAPKMVPDLTAELGFAQAQLAVLSPVVEQIKVGLQAPGIAGWTYAGRCAGFGTKLAGGTSSGFGGVAPLGNVNAVIIATDNFASWQSFSHGFATGGSASTNLGQRTDQERLAFHGLLSGGAWSHMLDGISKRLDVVLSTLEGVRNRVTASLRVLTGLEIPDVTKAINVALGGLSPSDWVTARLPGALEVMLGANTNFDAQIEGVTARIDNVLQLIEDVELALSGGGLTLWSYSGPARDLGASFAPEVASGLPGTTGGPDGATYGLVLAAASSEAWSAFGNIFKTS